MVASIKYCRLAFRWLGGTFLVMALLDVPAVVSPETGRVISVLLALMVLAGIAILALRRRDPGTRSLFRELRHACPGRH
jgi:hypothetical protein